MPLSWVSMAELNGKVEASEVVSMFLVMYNLSCPNGVVDLKPSSICKVAVLGKIKIELRVVISIFAASFSSLKLSEDKVT